MLTNCILYYNISILSNLLKLKEMFGETEEIIRFKPISPVAWQHINFLGRYEFEKPENPIDIDEIVAKLSKTPIEFQERAS